MKYLIRKESGFLTRYAPRSPSGVDFFGEIRDVTCGKTGGFFDTLWTVVVVMDM